MRIELDVSDKNTATALLGAASRYWCAEVTFEGRGWLPLVQGKGTAELVLVDDGGKLPTPHKVTSARVAAGLALLAVQHPDSFGRVVRGMADGDDGDRLLQLAAFGELVFG